MDPDDELCVCFHVTTRKLVNFIRIERPRRAAQLSECFGAGTGCGWCRPYLRQLFELTTTGAEASGAEQPTADAYRAMRERYLRERDVTSTLDAEAPDQTE